MLELWLWGLALVWACATALWLVSVRIKDVSIVDSFWSLGFVISTVFFAIQVANPTAPRLLHLALVCLWGLRLSIHIAIRHYHAGEEDYRYQKMRRNAEEAGKSFATGSLIRVFLLQGTLIAVIGLPLLWVQVGDRPPQWLWTDGLFVLLFAVGFFFEAVGDWQLSRFKADPSNRGEVLNTGLWRYTRHPNYFGDAVIWWSFGVCALGSTNGAYSLVGPAIMTFFLLKVSGVSLLEKDIEERRPAYREYKRRTPAFFPWWPQSTESEKSS